MSKYGNIRSKLIDGKSFHSLREGEDYIWLRSLKQDKKIKDFVCQHKIDIRINGKHWRFHFVDFLITLNDDRVKYVETKGFPTREWKMKMDVIVLTDPIPYLVNPSEKQILD